MDDNKITQKQLTDLLESHKRWLDPDTEGGQRLVLRESMLDGLDLSYSDLNLAVFDRCSLIDTNMEYSNLSHSYFEECHLNSADLHGCTMAHLTAEESTFNCANLNGCVISFSNFRNAKFETACMEEIIATNSVFIGAKLSYVKQMEGTQFAHCNLTRADFSESVLSGVSFVQSVVIEGKFDGTIIDFASSAIVGEILRQHGRGKPELHIALKAMTSGYLKKMPFDPNLYTASEHEWVTKIMANYAQEALVVDSG